MGCITITIDDQIYKMDAIYMASYFFIDDYYVKISRNQGGTEVALTPKPGTSEEMTMQAEGVFHNRLLAETVRLRQTGRDRLRRDMVKTIIAASLKNPEAGAPIPSASTSGTFLDDLDSELKDIIEKARSATYQDDPLGISKPLPYKNKPE